MDIKYPGAAMHEKALAALPDMVRVRQRFPSERVEDIPGCIARRFDDPDVRVLFSPGMRVAVCAGSRGIRNLQLVVRCVVRELRQLGAEPFIVPAMGSHGGATAEGQMKVLESYGITETAVGAPVFSSMETVVLGELDGIPVHWDKFAAEADGVVLVNRVKPHTDFKGPLESGLAKMAVIGLGKHAGAILWHRQGFDRFHRLIPRAAEYVFSKVPVKLGVALVENAYDETARIDVLPAGRILTEEPELLKLAKRLLPGLPANPIDVLIVDKAGKDISGAGMDPNVTGRTLSGINEGFPAPRIQRIVVRDLTEKTGGNACGVGVADVITKRLFDKIDFHKTYTNAITSTVPLSAKIPIVAKSDRDALALALEMCNRVEPASARIVRIRSTLELGELWVSVPCLDALPGHCVAVSEPAALRFDGQGNLLD